jgi:hypothetical protein
MKPKPKILFVKSNTGSVYDDPNDRTTDPWIYLYPQRRMNPLTERIGKRIARSFNALFGKKSE